MEFLKGTMLEIGHRGFNWGFLAFLTLGALCLWLVLVHRRSPKGFWPYQLEVLVLWSASLCGFSISRGSIWSDAVAFNVMVWFIAAVIGGIIVVVTRKRSALA